MCNNYKGDKMEENMNCYKFCLHGKIFLTEKSRNALIDRIAYAVPKNWKIYCNYMSAIFDTNRNDEKIKLKIISIGITDNIIALGIDTDIKTLTNSKYIIFGASSSFYNCYQSIKEIKEWVNFKTPIYVNAIIKM